MMKMQPFINRAGRYRYYLWTVAILAASMLVLSVGCGDSGSLAESRPTEVSDSSDGRLLEWAPPTPATSMNKAGPTGCNIAGTPLATYNGLDIHYALADVNAGEIEIFVRDSQASICRTIKLFQQTSLASDEHGFSAIIENNSTHLFGIEFWWSTTTDNTGGFSEWTNQDFLACDLTPSAGDNVKEDYVWGTKTASFTFDPATVASDPDIEDDFLDFYPGGDTLDGNADGEMLIELLANDDFMYWLAQHFGTSQQTMVGWRDWVRIGSTVKCLATGVVANPVCHVMIGWELAEATANLLCEHVVDCD